ncbi:hypothetical protein CLV54_2637 [Compostimonas suwonensis]|uniref:Uncharacterized protein n=1 Tax=Compostimonas suwonensis TaxID=1048394 RepID=A0A2M9BUR4_9MICO|nr:hypothetical protein CLV54_2637 [Compostimonas suwonensis]
MPVSVGAAHDIVRKPVTFLAPEYPRSLRTGAQSAANRLVEYDSMEMDGHGG